MSIRLVPKSVTLNDKERRNGPYIALFQLTQDFRGKGSPLGNIFLVSAKLDTFCYPTVQTAPCYVPSFLANVNSRSRSLYAIASPSVCLSSVTFVHPPQPVEILGQFFYGISYLGHPLTCTENFMELVPGKPL